MTALKWNVFICVFFRSERGGLHDNVQAAAMALLRAGHEVTVCAKAGSFLDGMQRRGARTVACDFSTASIEAVARGAPRYDIVHFHQGDAGFLSRQIAAKSHAPLVMTVHGRWLSNLPAFHQEVSTVFCVSPHLKYKIGALHPELAAKAIYLPNGLNIETFDISPRQPASGQFRLIVPSRFAADKRVMLDFLPALWEEQAKSRNAGKIAWTLAGEGDALPRLLDQAACLVDPAGKPLVQAVPWQAPTDLAKLMNGNDAAVAPGRSAMQAMGLGLPTIALGSAGCLGFMTGPALVQGIRYNFGGAGSARHAVSPAEAYRQLEWMLENRSLVERLGQEAGARIRRLFRQDGVDRKMLSAYASLLAPDRMS